MARAHLVASILLSACASAAGAEAKRSVADEPYVVERMRWRYRYEDDGTARAQSAARVRIQTDAGVQTFGVLPVQFRADAERLEIAVRVLKRDGSVVTAPLEAIHEVTAAVARDAPVYSDVREKQVAIPGLRPGDVLEWDVVRVVERPQISGQFWHQQRFVREVVVEDEQLEIDVPKARQVTRRSSPAAGEPRISEAGDRRTLTWRRSWTSLDEVARAREELARARLGVIQDAQRPPDVEVSSFRSWEELGEFWSALARPRAEPSPEIRARAAALTRGAGSDREKVQALYEFVSRDIRYTAIHLGMGGLQPRPAAETLSTEYGDCKDKHTLLAALLRAAGIDASPVLASTFAPLDPAVPDPGVTDHVFTLVRLGSEQFWLDSTALAPFGHLALALRGRKALVAERGGASRLADVPAAPAIPNELTVELAGRYDDAGRFTGRLHLAMRGDAEVAMRMACRRLPPGPHEALGDKLLSSFVFGGQATDVKWSDPTALREPFVIDVQHTRATALDPSTRWTVTAPSAVLTPPTARPGGSIPLNGPASATVKIRIETPPNRKLRAPNATRIERDFAEYRGTYGVEGHAAVAELALVWRIAELPAARAAEYETFRAALSKALESHFSAERIDDEDAKSLVEAGFEANKKREFGQAVDLFRKALDRAPDHPKAWGALGWTYLQLRRVDEAIPALQKQIALNPRDPFAYNNLGRAFRQSHRDREAEGAFRKQLEISPDDQYARKNLGVLLLETGRAADAIAELERAAAITPKDAEIRIRLGRAWLELNEDGEALAALEEAARLSPSPNVWNGAAYPLAEKGVHLDLAQRWAESAVASASARLAALSPENATREEAGLTRGLANYWDTLGWVHFRRGETDLAASYVAAAWEVNRSGVVADHLGQIRERQGRREEAARAYALAVAAGGPADFAAHLAAVTGGDDRAGSLVEAARAELARDRPLTGFEADAGSAEFLLVVAPGRGVEAAAFEKGDEGLRKAADALRAVGDAFPFPDARATKVVRLARLTCSARRRCSVELPVRSDR